MSIGQCKDGEIVSRERQTVSERVSIGQCKEDEIVSRDREEEGENE